MKKKEMKNSFYIFPFFFWVSCFFIVLDLICLVGMYVLADIPSEPLIIIILCTMIFIFSPILLLWISFFMMNKIEITQTSIRRKCFGKITKEIAYKDIIQCGSVDAHFNFKDEESRYEKIGMFCAWCYILDEEKKIKNLDQLIYNRKKICFKLTPKRKEIIMFYCPDEELKHKLFENVED